MEMEESATHTACRAPRLQDQRQAHEDHRLDHRRPRQQLSHILRELMIALFVDLRPVSTTARCPLARAPRLQYVGRVLQAEVDLSEWAARD